METQYALGDRCLVLRLKDTNIMLDCGFNDRDDDDDDDAVVSTMDNQKKKKKKRKVMMSQTDNDDLSIPLPEWLMCNMDHIDIIFISNYMSMMALPILFEKYFHGTKQKHFRAKIYATAPTVVMGQKALEDLREMAVRFATTTTLQNGGEEKKHFFGSHISLHALAALLTDDLIEKCFASVHAVSFHEPIRLFNEQLVACAVSSGYCIGGANWVIQNGEHEKIAFLAASSTASTRHPEPLDYRNTLADADLVIASDLNSQMFDNYQNDRQLHELCRAIGMTLSQGGDVLLPLDCSGPLLLDLVENLRMYLQSLNMHLSTIMFCVSLSVEHALSYSQITSEWMHPQRQARALDAEPPFIFQSLIKQQQFQFYRKFGQEFATAYQRHHTAGHRAIIFAGHPSLKFGPVCKLLEMLDRSAKNAVICVQEPIDRLPVRKMRHLNIPLDLRLTKRELMHLMREIRAKQLVLPSSHYDQTVAKSAEHVRAYTAGNSVLDLQLSKKWSFQRSFITPTMALQLFPQQLQDRLISRVKGAVVEARDGRFVIDQDQTSSRVQQQEEKEEEGYLLFGKLDLYGVVRSLQEQGFAADEIIVHEAAAGECVKVKIPAASAQISISLVDSTTNIETTHQDSRLADRMRRILRRLVVDNLVVV